MFKISEVNVRKFKLSDNFISQYKEREVPWVSCPCRLGVRVAGVVAAAGFTPDIGDGIQHIADELDHHGDGEHGQEAGHHVFHIHGKAGLGRFP